MQTVLDISLADRYRSPSQRIRVVTEHWVHQEVFCPACGSDITRYAHNRPAADFHCTVCGEQYELKSKKDGFASKIVDGAYRTLMERLRSSSNPSLFLLNYTPQDYRVVNFFVVPNHFFVPDMIERRRPLSVHARRPGWIGCNIVLRDIPETGRVFYVRNRRVESRDSVLRGWQRTTFLRDEKRAVARGWILDVMRCIERLGKREFDLGSMYEFEEYLRSKHPRNRHVRDKVRQQLQLLRDRGYLHFLGSGKYRVV